MDVGVVQNFSAVLPVVEDPASGQAFELLNGKHEGSNYGSIASLQTGESNHRTSGPMLPAQHKQRPAE